MLIVCLNDLVDASGNISMETTMKMIESDTDLDVAYSVAIERAMKGIRDPNTMEEAAREMDEGREEIRSRLGELNIAVELIREARDK